MEVRDEEHKCWHTARVADVARDKLQIAFEVDGAAGPQKSWVHWSAVREKPAKTQLMLAEVGICGACCLWLDSRRPS